MYDEKTVYVVGEAKSPENNPIMKQYDTFFVGFVIDRTDGTIVDADCTSVLGLTKKFVQSLFTGHNIWDSDAVTNRVMNRYLGSSQKAIIVAFRHAQIKYEQALESE
ncbi:DUF3870 domain-containing protein [Salibacterium aidingense]|uniref:DUF3870 domain-containing protein n=1 Tax=Salibacterium aidingense TaxID=384933 RepID=UPI000415165C|nr:DUF3870 domain-containing protein [Salibacterium aidingense]